MRPLGLADLRRSRGKATQAFAAEAKRQVLRLGVVVSTRVAPHAKTKSNLASFSILGNSHVMDGFGRGSLDLLLSAELVICLEANLKHFGVSAHMPL
jgi:hypothetical protein